jgi:hypothetical protein
LITTPFLFLFHIVSSFADLRAYIMLFPTIYTFTGRLFVMFLAIGCCTLVYKSSKILMPKVRPLSPVLILVSSILFLTFASALRPHVFIAFGTLMTFYASIHFAQNKKWSYGLWAFGSAALTFATLQTGLFAFVFPVFAFLISNGRFQWRRIFSWRLIVGMIGAIIAAFLIGYPSLVLMLLKGQMFGYSLGISDVETYPADIFGYSKAILMLVSDPFLLIFLLLSLQKRFRVHRTHPMFWAIPLYLLFYFGVVCLKDSISWIRVLIPTIPFVALLGAPALDALSPKKTIVVFLCIIAVHLRLFSLSLVPDTIEQARVFITNNTHGSISTGVPWYFLGIPPVRSSIDVPRMVREEYIKSLPVDLPGSRVILAPDQWQQSDLYLNYPWSVPAEMHPPEWTQCGNFFAAPPVHIMFMWNDVPYAYYWIWRTQALGQNLVLYCRQR